MVSKDLKEHVSNKIWWFWQFSAKLLTFTFWPFLKKIGKNNSKKWLIFFLKKSWQLQSFKNDSKCRKKLSWMLIFIFLCFNMLKAYPLQLFYIKRSGPDAWNHLNIAKKWKIGHFTLFWRFLLCGWPKITLNFEKSWVGWLFLFFCVLTCQKHTLFNYFSKKDLGQIGGTIWT